MTEYYIAWWNLENLFDTATANREPYLQKELKSELKGWTAAVLQKKINQLATIIKKMNNDLGPDLLGVCEVENKTVLQKLLNAVNIPGRTYKIVHHDCSDKRGIDVAFIYDSKKFGAGDQFFHVILKRSATRDLFQVNFKTKPNDNELIVIGNHWPSRSGGQYATQPYRILAGETLSYWIKRITEIKGDDVAIIAMGDFNDEPFDRSIREYALGSRERLKVTKATTAPRLYNLMWPELGSGRGTYYHDNFPNVLDQFMVSEAMIKNGATLKGLTGTVVIEDFKVMQEGTYKRPKRFGRPSAKKTYNDQGFSDHFPISMIVREK